MIHTLNTLIVVQKQDNFKMFHQKYETYTFLSIVTPKLPIKKVLILKKTYILKNSPTCKSDLLFGSVVPAVRLWRNIHVLRRHSVVLWRHSVWPSVWWRNSSVRWRDIFVLWRNNSVWWRNTFVLWRKNSVWWRNTFVLWRHKKFFLHRKLRTRVCLPQKFRLVLRSHQWFYFYLLCLEKKNCSKNTLLKL